MLCSCPKLTPLQSRFLASFLTLALLGAVYWTLSHPHFAYAGELELDGSGNRRYGEDHNWHRIDLEGDGGIGGRHEQVLEGGEMASQILSARAPEVSITGGNNVANIENLQAGSNIVWMFPTQQLRSRHAERGPGLPGDVQMDADMNLAHAELRRRDSMDDDDDDDDVEEEDFSDFEPRQNGQPRTIYISINTCLQPDYVGSGTQSAAPPQLTLYVASDGSNKTPGPSSGGDSQTAIPLEGGFASLQLSVSSDWYMSVHAPDLPDDFTGVWNYELAVSIDDYFHAVNMTKNLVLLDSDSMAALLVTDNLTQSNISTPNSNQWMDLTAPYIVFASNVNDTRTLGLSQSFCGLNKASLIAGKPDDVDGNSTNVQMQMTTRGQGNKPKEQFYIASLNRSSTYRATLAQVGNSTDSGSGVVGGGGKVWQTITFPTKSDGNCALLFNLEFCSEVAYAVPSTPDLVGNYSNFQFIYDNYTLTYYQNFNYSLQQIPCHTTSNAQYSLAHNCADCASAYKDWLCAVSIPRCEDFSNPAAYLQERNMGQPFYNGSSLAPTLLDAAYTPMFSAPTLEGTIAYSQTYFSSVATNRSRNPMIDEIIKPGPYKEVLPCGFLCYGLVQSCPAALGFGCPYPGKGFEASYGRMGNGNETLSCSYMGAYVYTDSAGRMGRNVWASIGVALVVGVMGVL